ncbi:MAG: glucosidase [Bacteroidetes bacterium]|nr:glucosidase [Bacteroidota bacterium]MBS1930950.1 glucosidase [Bacteroidota bacterium]
MISLKKISAEQTRLNENAQKEVPLEKWGPYLSERQWGTVREDYSPNGDAWNYCTHEQSRSRVYRWGEDGIAGISDMHQNLCFAIALWNGKDGILKERLFGLTNTEGNHGEDVKELYYYLDNTPTHYYMEYLYKYPQAAFPYEILLEENRKRSKKEPEFEILDTGVFAQGNYFDVKVTYAKNNSEDICIDITITNQGDSAAEIILLPTLWFRNRWLFGDVKQKPALEIIKNQNNSGVLKVTDEKSGSYFFYYSGTPETLMTENETNTEKIFGIPNSSPFVKDAFHDAIAGKNNSLYELLKNNNKGTKFSPVYPLTIQGNSSQKIVLRLSKDEIQNPFNDFEDIFIKRKKEADEFYKNLLPQNCNTDISNIQRQAFAGLLWTKQFYQYDVERWLNGDPGEISPPPERKAGRNEGWENLKAADVLSMPDKWEYPWFAAWDLCFHCIPMAMIDPVFAKNQMILLCREWYMDPFGQIPAYEWNFSDVNPPLQAWAALQVYNIEKKIHGHADIYFLKRIFQKLVLNFTWWANREDENENNIFTGGFLGMDNIGAIDRDSLPPGTFLEQVDATAWMGMYALNMMEMALEIAQADNSYEDMVTKFYEHFVLIASSLNETLWDENDNFFYDCLHNKDGSSISMKVRSIVGLSVLFNAGAITCDALQKLPDFKKRMDYIRQYRKDRNEFLPCEETSDEGHLLISLVHKSRLIKLLSVMLDENEFLSTGGIRALSKFHKDHPFVLQFNNNLYSIQYQPGESDSSMFGGNSNWRGPVWIPLNYLIIKTLQQLNDFYGNTIRLSFPSGKDNSYNLDEIARAVSTRIINSFQLNEQNSRCINGNENWFYNRPENKNLVLFYECLHGDTARGVGASHQTGWSSLIAALINHEF